MSRAFLGQCLSSCWPSFLKPFFSSLSSYPDPKTSPLHSQTSLLCVENVICVCAKSLQSCLTLCNAMDCSLPGSSVHWILQYLSGLPCPPPGDLPDPGIRPMSFTAPALAGRFFTTSATWEALKILYIYLQTLNSHSWQKQQIIRKSTFPLKTHCLL